MGLRKREKKKENLMTEGREGAGGDEEELWHDSTRMMRRRWKNQLIAGSLWRAN
jgi:protein subunit release factor A